jgi:hypothetical protein
VPARLEVRWPDGTEEVFTGLTVNGRLTLSQGSGQPAAPVRPAP